VKCIVFRCYQDVSNNPLQQDTFEVINVIPQIEIDTIVNAWNYWQHFSFIYKADSSYKYITIGNFKDDVHTLISATGKNGAYYFIDKIEIFDLIIGDSATCFGNTATLRIYDDSIVKWADSLSPGTIIATDSIVTVVPTLTTTYMAFTNNDTEYFIF